LRGIIIIRIIKVRRKRKKKNEILPLIQAPEGGVKEKKNQVQRFFDLCLGAHTLPALDGYYRGR
jgi:hypothetical protein